MSNIDTLEKLVHDLYNAKDPQRTEWADWLGEHHVFTVADNATKLARRFGANPELARAAALLHDIADTKMSRFDPAHEEASLMIARDLLRSAHFAAKEIDNIVEDAIRYHSCHDGHVPESLEGKVLATADSLAHLQTDFYVFATWSLGKHKSYEDTKTWVLKKIHRDFHDKILFSEVQQEVRADYDQLETLFKR